MTTPPKPIIRIDAPASMVDQAQAALDARNRINPETDRSERRRAALETLRRAHKSADHLHRNIGSMLRQVEELIDAEERKDTAA